MQEEKDSSVPKSGDSTLAQRARTGLGAVFLVLASAAAGFGGGLVGSNAKQQDAFSTKDQQQIISSESELISDIAKRAGPSVVSVNVTTRATSQGFFGPRQYGQQSAGTGFIVSKEGLIVTNRHVVNGSDEVSVTLSDGTELTDVELVGQTNESDPLDIAFLKIKDAKGKELKPATIGDSSKMEVGSRVIAIGNALGQFQNTVTTGIISGYGRDVEASDGSGYNVETLQNLFQTDAAINQGNSGGPLMNINGEVIGVNTAVAGGGAENIGFAMPINDLRGLIDGVLSRGKLERPYIGVRYVALTDDYAYELELDIKRGAYIVPGSAGQPSIIKGSPADKAGLKEEDIITKVNGEDINERNSLTSLIGRHEPGKEVELTIVRGGKEQKVKVTLEATPSS